MEANLAPGNELNNELNNAMKIISSRETSRYLEAYKTFENIAETIKGPIGEEAKSRLTYCLYYGIGIESNKKKAYEMLNNVNTPYGYFLRGIIYINGIIDLILPNPQKAIICFNLSIKGYPVESNIKLGDIYMEMYNTNNTNTDNKILEKAKECYKKSVESKNAEAMYKLAVIYIMQEKKPKKTIKLLTQSKELNNSDAIFKLAYLYQNGILVEKDIDKAIELFKQVDTQVAHYNLGILYAGKKMYGDAKECYIKANIPQAYYNLGLIEANNKYFSEAFLHFKIAAVNGIKEAQQILASYYQFGKGTEINFQEAIKWFEKCGDCITVLNMYYLAYLYHNLAKATDTDKNSINYQHCLYWFKKSSAHGYNGATYCLALCYIKGLGMKKKNYPKGIKLYVQIMKCTNNEKVIENFNSILTEAIQFYTSKLNDLLNESKRYLRYNYNLGVLNYYLKNYDAAITFYEEAAYNKYPIAQKALSYCYKKGIYYVKSIESSKIWYNLYLNNNGEDEDEDEDEDENEINID